MGRLSAMRSAWFVPMAGGTQARSGGTGAPVAGALAVGLAAGWNIANTGAAAGTLSSAYGVSLPTIGLLTTALFLTHFGSQVPGGILIDRFGPRPVGFAALSVIAVGNAIALAFASFPLAVVARLIIGLGTGTGFVAGSDWVRAARRSSVGQGLYGGFSVAGGGLAVLMVPLLEPALGWRSAYVAALGVSLVPLVGLTRSAELAAHFPNAYPFRRVVHERPLYLLAALHTASFGLSVIASNWVVSLLTRRGVSHGVAGLVGSLLLLGGLATRPLAGVVVRRRPHLERPLLSFSMIGGGAGIAVLATPAPIPVLTFAACLAGLAAGVPFASVFTGAQRIQPASPAAAIGLVNAVATFTILAGTPLVGLSFLLPGDGRIGFAVLAALWCSAACAVPAAYRALISGSDL